MKKTIFLLYITDAWNSNPVLLVPCTTKKIALKLAKNDAKYREKQLTEYEVNFLEEYYQTQGRDENYQIEEIKLNTLEL
jgi:hypothetical protein